MKYSRILSMLEENGIEKKCDYDLGRASTFAIGGTCDIAIFPKNAEEIALCVCLLDSEGIDFHVAGRCSNTLFCDKAINKAIIFTSGASKIDIKENIIIAEAGASLMKLSAVACENGLGGLEFACGIPGCVGGAMYMNAGAHGGAMSDVVFKSRAYDRKSGSIITLEEHDFGYRKSVYMSDPLLICLEVVFELIPEQTQLLRERVKANMTARRQSQPLEYNSAGSYFKRPEGSFAGKLIDECGLKGARVGGAEVSEKHAGFIINRGGATFDDVLALEAQIVQTVFEKTGIKLEREVEIVR